MKTEVTLKVNCEGCGSEMEYLWILVGPKVELDIESIGFDFECTVCESTTETYMSTDFYEDDNEGEK